MDKITPRIDIAFKKIFGVEENKDLLISLINSIVSQEDQVADVTLLNPYNLQSFRHDKLSILDVKALGVDGKRYNIEIQISDEADYDKRALYYWAKLYTEQIKLSDDYNSLSKAIGIHILNFISIPDIEKYHNVFHVTEKESGYRYFKDLELHTIELKKFTNDSKAELSDIISLVKNSLDMWVAFLTRHELLNKEHLPRELESPALKKALDVLDVMNFSAEERQAYEERVKFFMVESNTFRKVEAKGFERGKEVGREEGIEAGIEVGQRNIARKMLSKGLEIQDISELTGLSIEEIKSLAP